MKRLILFIPAFLIAFAIGSASVAKFTPSTGHAVAPAEVTFRYEPVSYPTELPDQKNGFEPEFRGLPEIYSPDDFKIKLIDVALDGNAYRKSEVIARNGEKWLGLFEENGNTYLREVTTKVNPDPDYVGYGDEDYVRLSTGQKREPRLLLKNARQLKTGPIETYYLGPSFDEVEKRHLTTQEMKLGYEQQFEIGRQNWYTLRVAPGQTRSGEKVNVLALESGDVTQVVTYNAYSPAPDSYDTIGYLHWAGDIDGDGKLDLYLEHFNYEKGGFSSSLFLSSEAGKGELVKEAASFGTAGC